MNEKCNDCGECCIETEMPLSKKDINNILANLGQTIKIKDFTIKNEEGYYQLKNKGKYCFFLDINSKTCTIYKFRPQGCRFYPLIYDLEKKECTLDELCPRKKLFTLEGQELRMMCKELKQFITNDLNIIWE